MAYPGWGGGGGLRVPEHPHKAHVNNIHVSAPHKPDAGGRVLIVIMSLFPYHFHQSLSAMAGGNDHS